MKHKEPGEMYNAYKRKMMKKHKNWIAGAIKHPGALRRTLGVSGDKSIPASKLHAAAKKGGVTGRRAGLAETLKGFKHKKNDHDADDKMKRKKKKHVKMAALAAKAGGKKNIKAIVKIQKSHEKGMK